MLISSDVDVDSFSSSSSPESEVEADRFLSARFKKEIGLASAWARHGGKWIIVWFVHCLFMSGKGCLNVSVFRWLRKLRIVL